MSHLISPRRLPQSDFPLCLCLGAQVLGSLMGVVMAPLTFLLFWNTGQVRWQADGLNLYCLLSAGAGRFHMLRRSGARNLAGVDAFFWALASIRTILHCCIVSTQTVLFIGLDSGVGIQFGPSYLDVYHWLAMLVDSQMLQVQICWPCSESVMCTVYCAQNSCNPAGAHSLWYR